MPAGWPNGNSNIRGSTPVGVESDGSRLTPAVAAEGIVNKAVKVAVPVAAICLWFVLVNTLSRKTRSGCREQTKLLSNSNKDLSEVLQLDPEATTTSTTGTVFEEGNHEPL